MTTVKPPAADPETPAAVHADPADTIVATSTPRDDRPGLIAILVGRFSGVGIIGLFILIFALWIPDTFLTSATVKDLLGEQAITATLAIGLVFALAAGQFDLSVGATLAASNALAAELVTQHGVAALPAILITLAFGLVVGVANGLVVVGARVHSFIATLGMSSILIAVTSKLLNGQFLTGAPTSFTSLGTREPLGIPILAFYAAVIAVIAWYVLEHTPFGRRTHAVGAGPEAARLAGVPAARLVFASLVLSSVIASAAGIMLAMQVGGAAPTDGSAYLLPAFAAALLGSTQILPGRVNVAGALVAIILLAIGIKGLQLAGAQDWVTSLFNGVALIVAVSAANLAEVGAVLRMRRAAKRASAAAPDG